jgi:hypothetical protein
VEVALLEGVDHGLQRCLIREIRDDRIGPIGATGAADLEVDEPGSVWDLKQLPKDAQTVGFDWRLGMDIKPLESGRIGPAEVIERVPYLLLICVAQVIDERLVEVSPIVVIGEFLNLHLHHSVRLVFGHKQVPKEGIKDGRIEIGLCPPPPYRL